MMWPNTLMLRNLAEQLRRGLHLVTEAPQAADDRLVRPTHIRLPPTLIRKGNEKRDRAERDPSKLNTMVGHVTDVRGGYGVQKWGPDGWNKWAWRMRIGAVPSVAGEHGSLYEEIRREFGELPDAEMARVLALCSRYAQTPYHRLTSQKLGEVVNRPLEHRTYAAGAGNGGVSMAIDCHHREEVSPAVIRAGRNMVQWLYSDLRKAGVMGSIRYTVHGQWAHPRRRGNDTHAFVHQNIYKPAIEELQRWGEDVFIDYEHAAGGGRPLTTRDDPDAHFDERGRRVRTPEGELL